jgi:hypothetical protein
MTLLTYPLSSKNAVNFILSVLISRNRIKNIRQIPNMLSVSQFLFYMQNDAERLLFIVSFFPLLKGRSHYATCSYDALIFHKLSSFLAFLQL